MEGEWRKRRGKDRKEGRKCSVVPGSGILKVRPCLYFSTIAESIYRCSICTHSVCVCLCVCVCVCERERERERKRKRERGRGGGRGRERGGRCL
jgi:hypothetical protein